MARIKITFDKVADKLNPNCEISAVHDCNNVHTLLIAYKTISTL